MKNKFVTYMCGGLCLLALGAFILQPVVSAFTKPDVEEVETVVGKPVSLVFDADSAYQFCADQCDFGPRNMNTIAHDKCAEWIKQKFQQYGCTVESQKADLKGYDGTVLKSENIIARYNPEAKSRILICAHWDSRPWADNDPDESKHKEPVMAANDAASGVAVMLEMARVLSQSKEEGTPGIDFVCFDAEDWGVEGDDDSWALGAQYWAKQVTTNSQYPPSCYKYGILLDMVGGEGAYFYQERLSLHYAEGIVMKVWAAAEKAGFAEFFPKSLGGYITDDHKPVNEIAGIKCIDIIPYYPDCEESSFGPTWHTVSDTMENISKATLKAVGQTVLQAVLETPSA